MIEFKRQILVCMGAVLLAACSPFGERTTFSIQYYSISGKTFEELDQQIKLHGPNVLGVGKALASTDLRITPKLYMDYVKGGCAITRSRFSVNARVTLPRHSDENSLKKELAQAWGNLEEYARIHEAVHLAIADRYALRMEQAVAALPPAADCSKAKENAKAAFSALFEQHHQEQLAFDAAEKQRIKRLLSQN